MATSAILRKTIGTMSISGATAYDIAPASDILRLQSTHDHLPSVCDWETFTARPDSVCF